MPTNRKKKERSFDNYFVAKKQEGKIGRIVFIEKVMGKCEQLLHLSIANTNNKQAKKELT